MSKISHYSAVQLFLYHQFKLTTTLNFKFKLNKYRALKAIKYTSIIIA